MITAFHEPITEPQKPTPAAYAVAECCGRAGRQPERLLILTLVSLKTREDQPG